MLFSQVTLLLGALFTTATSAIPLPEAGELMVLPELDSPALEARDTEKDGGY